MKKILFLSAFSSKTASGLIGGPIFRDHFIRSGYSVRFLSRGSKAIDTIIMACSRRFPRLAPMIEVFLRYMDKFWAPLIDWYSLRIAKHYDTICLLKIQSLAYIQNLRKYSKGRIVLYFGDAVWLYKGNGHFGKVLELVDTVATDNIYTATYAKQFNKDCRIIADYPQIELFDKYRSLIKKGNDTIRIGWLGSASTVYNLFLIWEVLERVFVKHRNLHLRLVGTGYRHEVLPRFANVKVSMRPDYTQTEMIEEVLAMDIGLFPLQDVEVSRYRGVLKASIYMSGEAAVICSPIGECKEFIRDGVDGMLAKDNREWEQKLEMLITNAELQKTIAKKGLEKIRAEFSLERSFETIRRVLEK